jgi:hypothetical protein
MSSLSELVCTKAFTGGIGSGAAAVQQSVCRLKAKPVSGEIFLDGAFGWSNECVDRTLVNRHAR